MYLCYIVFSRGRIGSDDGSTWVGVSTSASCDISYMAYTCTATSKRVETKTAVRRVFSIPYMIPGYDLCRTRRHAPRHGWQTMKGELCVAVLQDYTATRRQRGFPRRNRACCNKTYKMQRGKPLAIGCNSPYSRTQCQLCRRLSSCREPIEDRSSTKRWASPHLT